MKVEIEINNEKIYKWYLKEGGGMFRAINVKVIIIIAQLRINLIEIKIMQK